MRTEPDMVEYVKDYILAVRDPEGDGENFYDGQKHSWHGKHNGKYYGHYYEGLYIAFDAMQNDEYIMDYVRLYGVDEFSKIVTYAAEEHYEDRVWEKYKRSFPNNDSLLSVITDYLVKNKGYWSFLELPSDYGLKCQLERGY